MVRSTKCTRLSSQLTGWRPDMPASRFREWLKKLAEKMLGPVPA
jgi:hypothetical protein